MTKSRHRNSLLVGSSCSRWTCNADPAQVSSSICLRIRRLRRVSRTGACVHAHVIVYALGANVVLHSISGEKGMKLFSSSPSSFNSNLSLTT
ncbi:unnamed protein product [Calypogeia fissa]